jgi:geranylgeranyl diphosphate synthase type II
MIYPAWMTTIFGEVFPRHIKSSEKEFAFELLTLVPGWPRYPLRDVVQELAVAAGSRNLIAGQVVDLESEGKNISLPLLNFIHESKTAALLRSSIRLGAMSANATPAQLRNLSDFGRSLGLAFQVIDDILDVTQTTEKLGKSAGKDVAAEKATFPAVVGLERSRRIAQKLTKEARDALRPFGKRAEILHGMADYLLERDY